MIKGTAQQRREKLKKEFWKDDIAWTGEKETGWFRAPRSLPLILTLLSTKQVSGTSDPTRVYLELLARHRDSGIVEMVSEGEHSYAAGYPGPRGIRTWQERMGLLEQCGFIKSIRGGNQHYKYVLLIHPTAAIAGLKESGKIPQNWWDLYRQRQIETTEASYEDLMVRHQPPKVAAEKSPKPSRQAKMSSGRANAKALSKKKSTRG